MVLIAVAAALVAGTAAFTSCSAVRVSINVVGDTQLEVGQAAKLSATAKLPKGARLMIQALPTGRTAAKIAECRRSPCSLTNLQTGQTNEHCEPFAYLSGGDLTFPGPIPVGRDGSFSISSTVSGTVGGEPSTDAVEITGHITGGTASGTYRVDSSFTYEGQGYGCTTGDQTWTASRTG